MSNLPLVSVVMPCYQAEATVAGALSSVLNQNYDRYEVIVVDDGSDDGSLTVIESILAESPRGNLVNIIRHGENKGCAAARRTGMMAATGEYIIQVDCDDTVEPDFLSRLVAAAIAANADVTVCDFKVRLTNGHTSLDVQNVAERRDRLVADALLGALHNSLNNKLFKRSLLVDNDLYTIPGINMCDDKAVCVPALMLARTVIHVDSPLYCYHRDRSGSVTRQAPSRHHTQLIQLIRYLQKFLIAHNASPEVMSGLDGFKANVMASILLYGDRHLLLAYANEFSSVKWSHIWRHPVIPFYYKCILSAYKLRLDPTVAFIRRLNNRRLNIKEQ